MQLPTDRRGWVKLAAVAVAAIAAFMLIKRALPDFDAQDVLEDISGKLGAWTYAIVAVLAFLETGAFVGLVAPGETFVVLAGAVAGQGETSVVLTIGIVWFAAFMGDTVSYVLGEKLGRDFILEHGHRVRITRERFAQVERYFDSHGGKTILIGRFIGLVRALAPFIAGSSGMRYRAMAPYSILGTGLWATAFVLLGYFASKNIDAVLSNSEHVLLAFAIIVGLIVGAIVAVRFLREPENRDKVERWMQQRRGFRSILALGKSVSPQARFLAQRVTPGDLGLELTSALAALAVGSYLFIALGMLVHDQPGATVTDQALIDFCARITTDWLTSLSKVVTALGTTPAVLVATLAAAVWLGLRRHWLELVVLLVGAALILIGTPIAKEIVDRPRPDGALVDAGGPSYPSGHASHSIIYVWIALMISVRAKVGLTRGTAIVVAGIALAAAIGLSRVYLRVHYLSDVTGGWAFGVTVYALLAAVAVLVSYFRQDGQRVD
ncbi:MAG: bifunctional DedA family/phosphatase PAP2 family protein [Solirubrobacterales bacterium]|nr:bifunctional DedA family/phosphatase PAP2 family protein [Solirubrobacterales bacterium]